MKRTIIVCSVAFLILAALAPESGAEVRVHTRADGEYQTVTVVPGGPPWNQGVWSGGRGRLSLRSSSHVLNPMGDRIGDLVPTIVESSREPHHPWAVWSRFNGTDYDLVYSSWDYSWNAISEVSRESLRGDDLNPSLAFDRVGRPLLAWWNRDADDGHGTIYLSMFLESGWSEPVQISNEETGGRYPTIMMERGNIVIEYESDDGSMQMTFQIQSPNPTTITDDIDPQATLAGGAAEIVKETGGKD
jgi:hypothetical protein